MKRMCAFVLMLAIASSKHVEGKESLASTSEAAYAKSLIAALEKARKVHDLHFDAEHHEILGGDGTHIWITNLYAEWFALPDDQRDAALYRVARVLSSKVDAAGEPLDQVRNRLLPAVRASLYFASSDLLPSGGTEEPPPALPHTALGNAAAVGIGIDSTDSIRLVSTKDVDKWNVPFAALEQIAIGNLRRRGASFEQLERGVWAARTKDTYAAARVLLVDEIAKLGLAGGAVALIPSRDLLLLAGAKDSKALLAIAGRADVAAEEPRPIHTIALCLRDARWSDCIPDPTPEVHTRFHELALRSWSTLYEEQKKPLQEKLGDQVFVGSLSVVKNNETGEIRSYTTWTKSVPTMLPRAEVVVFVEVGANEKPKVLGMVPWDRVIAVCGHHLKPDGRTPERWATSDWFPSEADLAQMAPARGFFTH
jgi:hypothetical protein